MDRAEAARQLSVAEHEIVDVRPADGWWEALHHDMSSHEEAWRRVPGTPKYVGEQGPELIDAETVANIGNALASEQPERDSGVEGSPESGFGEVPDGTVAAVLDWVGDDSDRAVAAIEAEEARDQPRTTLVAALEKVVV